MKRYLKLIFVFLSISYVKGYSQICPAVSDLNATNVCGLYGDANGNSNWNWEITDVNDPNYCKQWYARTQSITSNLTPMGSPFVNPSTTGLDAISQSKDFKREKGWELLQRDFGCSHVIAYPYFVLYNKYSGLMRIFVYQPAEAPQYSSVLIQIEPTKSPWPATTSLDDSLIIAPDKYLSSNTAGTGKMVLAVSEQGGDSKWSLTEFSPGFDPNIQDATYRGAGLKFTIFGVLTNNIKATIKGTSVSSTDPSVYNFNYSPKNAPGSSDGQNFDFKAAGEKFAKFGKTITEVRDNVHKAADNIVNSIPNSPLEASVLGRTKALAAVVRNATESDEGFGQVLGKVASLIGAAGGVLGFVGNVVGLFSGGLSKPAPMPVYTSYNLVLDGTLTAKTVQESFIIRVPGTPQTDNNNATYYKCPVGIFNIKNTPEANKIVYFRNFLMTWQPDPLNFTGPPIPLDFPSQYVSYKMRNNLQVSFNSGAGLDLVSAQAAIVAEILPGSDGNAAFDLLQEHYKVPYFNYAGDTVRFYNYMLPDLQAGRLALTVYDPVHKLHTFQTPYVNIECLNGLTFNTRIETNVFLRIRAVLKKTNDPDNTPIYYIRDYAIQTFDGSLDPNLGFGYTTDNAQNYPAPYTNYTDLPLYVSDRAMYGSLYYRPAVEKADNSITTQGNVIVTSSQDVTYQAGYAVNLEPGFQAQAGSRFLATLNKYGYTINCGTPQNEAFQYPGGCYNNAISALRAITTQNKPAEPDNELKIYPIPTSNHLIISGLKNYKDAIISVIDESGRCVRQIKSPASDEGGTINLDVSSLDNGVYFIKIQNQAQITTRKIVVSK